MDTHFPPTPEFVRWFRGAAPYVHAFRGSTFVVVFGGEVLADGQFMHLASDLALLNSLGVRLVLVHGARPQIESRLKACAIRPVHRYGMRVTDAVALGLIKEAVGQLRLEIEATLSMGLANTPMAGSAIRVVSGNFVVARPIGVRFGVDYEYTGEVRGLDSEGIQQSLDRGEMVLLPPVGYSLTGELFNLSAEELAGTAATRLQADKLLFLVDRPGLEDRHGELQRQITPAEARTTLEKRTDLPEEITQHLRTAVAACESGVRRIHLIDRHYNGAILQELFTREGVGTLITSDPYEGTRTAGIDDIGGILELIEPLEKAGILVRRSREHLETEIDHFLVMERDGMILATAALYPATDRAIGELGCLAVRPEYRERGYGGALLQAVETRCREMGLSGLFVLTTQTAHWFQERGFIEVGLDALPVERQALYNLERGSKVFWKELD